MNDISVRRTNTGDIHGLYRIWTTVFGDDGAGVFFSTYAGEYTCIAAISDDLQVAAGYLIPHGHLVCGDERATCAMIYSVATLQEYRNLGLGATIVRELISAGRDTGYEAIVLCPSEDSLFDYYSTRAGFSDWFYADETVAINTAPLIGDSELAGISPVEYHLLREDILGDTPHIELCSHALVYQDHLCREYGGGFFRIDSPAGLCCAIVEKQQDGAVRVIELLGTGSPENGDGKTKALSLIASAFPAESYTIRRPVPFSAQAMLSSEPLALSPEIPALSPENPGMQPKTRAPIPASLHRVRRFGMIVASDNIFSQNSTKNMLPWYGPAFD